MTLVEDIHTFRLVCICIKEEQKEGVRGGEGGGGYTQTQKGVHVRPGASRHVGKDDGTPGVRDVWGDGVWTRTHRPCGQGTQPLPPTDNSRPTQATNISALRVVPVRQPHANSGRHKGISLQRAETPRRRSNSR